MNQKCIIQYLKIQLFLLLLVYILALQVSMFFKGDLYVYTVMHVHKYK